MITVMFLPKGSVSHTGGRLLIFAETKFISPLFARRWFVSNQSATGGVVEEVSGVVGGREAGTLTCNLIVKEER